MASLQGLLGSIPGLGGFAAGDEERRAQIAAQSQQQMGQLQQVGALQGILAKAREQQIAARYQDAMGRATTDEQRLAAATAASGPAGVIQHADRQAARDNTKQLAMSRLAQSIQKDAAEIAHKARTATTQEEKFHWQQQMDTLKATAQIQAADIAAGRYNYDTGMSVAPFQGVVPQAAPAGVAAPASGALAAPQPPRGALATPSGYTSTPQLPAGEALQTTAPTENAALAQFAGGGGAPRTVEVQPTAFPNNMDARDLRLQGGLAGIAAAAQPTAAPTAAPAVTTDANGRPLSPRALSQIAVSNQRPSIAGNAPITPETATRLAQQVLAGDTAALSGLARNQTGLSQVQNEVTRLGAQANMSGGDIVQNKAKLGANKVALTAVTKDLIAITPFKEMLDQNADIAMTLGRKIADDKTNSAFVNRPLLWVKNNLSDRPDIAEYLAQMHFVEVEAARVLTQPRLVGQLTDQAISDIKSVISGNMTIASTEAVLNRIKADGNNRINAMKEAQSRTLAEISGKPARTRSTDKATGVDTSNPLLR